LFEELDELRQDVAANAESLNDLQKETKSAGRGVRRTSQNNQAKISSSGASPALTESAPLEERSRRNAKEPHETAEPVHSMLPAPPPQEMSSLADEEGIKALEEKITSMARFTLRFQCLNAHDVLQLTKPQGLRKEEEGKDEETAAAAGSKQSPHHLFLRWNLQDFHKKFTPIVEQELPDLGASQGTVSTLQTLLDSVDHLVTKDMARGGDVRGNSCRITGDGCGSPNDNGSRSDSWRLPFLDEIASRLHGILGDKKQVNMLNQCSYGIPILDAAPGEPHEYEGFSGLDAVYLMLGTISSAHTAAVLQSQVRETDNMKSVLFPPWSEEKEAGTVAVTLMSEEKVSGDSLPSSEEKEVPRTMMQPRPTFQSQQNFAQVEKDVETLKAEQFTLRESWRLMREGSVELQGLFKEIEAQLKEDETSNQALSRSLYKELDYVKDRVEAALLEIQKGDDNDNSRQSNSRGVMEVKEEIDEFIPASNARMDGLENSLKLLQGKMSTDQPLQVPDEVTEELSGIQKKLRSKVDRGEVLGMLTERLNERGPTDFAATLRPYPAKCLSCNQTTVPEEIPEPEILTVPSGQSIVSGRPRTVPNTFERRNGKLSSPFGAGRSGRLTLESGRGSGGDLQRDRLAEEKYGPFGFKEKAYMSVLKNPGDSHKQIGGGGGGGLSIGRKTTRQRPMSHGRKAKNMSPTMSPSLRVPSMPSGMNDSGISHLS